MPTRTLVHAPRNVEHIPPKPHPHPEHMQAHHDGTAQTPPLLMQRAHQSPAQLGATDIAYLQRTVGNHAVDHLLHPQQPSTLKVGPAHDPFEAQADTVARSVAGAPVQRAVAGGSAPMGREGGALDGATAQTIRHAQRGGQPIPDPVRAPVEQALHADLSHARLHVGAQADDLSQRMGARAFTTGRDIFVQRSEYRPDSRAGRSLLYHESLLMLPLLALALTGLRRRYFSRGFGLVLAMLGMSTLRSAEKMKGVGGMSYVTLLTAQRSIPVA